MGQSLALNTGGFGVFVDPEATQPSHPNFGLLFTDSGDFSGAVDESGKPIPDGRLDADPTKPARVLEDTGLNRVLGGPGADNLFGGTGLDFLYGADGPSRLANIGSWRVKETDRIAAMATELRKLGAQVEEGPDWLRITPPHALRLTPHAVIDTYDDHRMAMSFSLAALGGVRVRINEPGCVAKTFPEYFAVLAGISETAA